MRAAPIYGQKSFGFSPATARYRYVLVTAIGESERKGPQMANTIFDTDFRPDDEVLLYEGSRLHWGGKVGDMTESDKEDYDVATWFLLDKVEGYKALFVR